MKEEMESVSTDKLMSDPSSPVCRVNCDYQWTLREVTTENGRTIEKSYNVIVNPKSPGVPSICEELSLGRLDTTEERSFISNVEEEVELNLARFEQAERNMKIMNCLVRSPTIFCAHDYEKTMGREKMIPNQTSEKSKLTKKAKHVKVSSKWETDTLSITSSNFSEQFPNCLCNEFRDCQCCCHCSCSCHVPIVFGGSSCPCHLAAMSNDCSTTSSSISFDETETSNSKANGSVKAEKSKVKEKKRNNKTKKVAKRANKKKENLGSSSEDTMSRCSHP